MGSIALAFVLLQLGAQPVQQPRAGDAIVVSGRRAQEALENCLARDCPPAEEVEAAMAAATEAFAAGRYEQAKSILGRAIGRNKRHAAQMPTKMADLYATYADVTEHFGDETASRHATLDSVAVLRKHLGESSPTTIAALQRTGDMLMRIGPVSAADQAYARAAATAREAGLTPLAASFEMRRAWLAITRHDMTKARRLIATARGESAGNRRIEGLAQALDLRIALLTGDDVQADRLFAQLRGLAGDAPILVSAPPYQLPETQGGSPFDATGNLDLTPKPDAREVVPLRWADIGFWVRPDGRTEDASVIRPLRGTGWTKPLLRQIEGRRYAVTGGSEAVGSYRIERFTLRAKLGVATGSRIVARYGAASLHVIDMTKATPQPEADPGARAD